MNKIIITHTNDVPRARAMYYAAMVIGHGKVSSAEGIEHYRWSTLVRSGHQIITKLKKTAKSPDVLHVRKMTQQEIYKAIEDDAFQK